MEQVNFVTCGDEGYGTTIKFMARNLEYLFPKSTTWVFDWGMKAATRRKLNQLSTVNIIDWKNITEPKFRICIAAQRLGWILDNGLLRRAGLGFNNVRHLFGFEYILIEKIRCFLDVSERIGDRKLVFFDGDAFPIREIDALLDPAFDLSLTIRRPHELRWDFNACAVLNSGVIGFGADAAKRGRFLRHWLRVALDCREIVAEQTALTRIIEEQDRDILRPGGQGTIEVEGTRFSVQVLSGDEYNFNHIEELVENGGKIPDSIRVLHFKGGRFRDPRLQPIIEQADLGGSRGHTVPI